MPPSVVNEPPRPDGRQGPSASRGSTRVGDRRGAVDVHDHEGRLRAKERHRRLEESAEVAVELPVAGRTAAERRWIQQQSVVEAAAPPLAVDESPGVLVDPADGRDVVQGGVLAGPADGRTGGVDVGDPRARLGEGHRGAARVGEQVEDLGRGAGRLNLAQLVGHPGPVGSLLGKQAGVAGGGAADRDTQAGVLDWPPIGQRGGSRSVPAREPPPAADPASAHPAFEDGVGALPGRLVEGARSSGPGVRPDQHRVAPAFEALTGPEIEENVRSGGSRRLAHRTRTIARLAGAMLCSSGFVVARTPYLVTSRKVGVRCHPPSDDRDARAACRCLSRTGGSAARHRKSVALNTNV